MATSSSDESTAPKLFNLSSSLDSGSRLSPNKKKCPLCGSFKKVFYCKECVHNGLFYHSKTKATEGYIDKRRTLLEVEEQRRTIEKKCLELLETPQKADILKSRIRQCREKNKLLTLLIEDKKKKHAEQKVRLAYLTDRTNKLVVHLPKYEAKVQSFVDCISSRHDDLRRSKEALENNKVIIKKLVKTRAEQLLKYIFTVEEVEPRIEMGSSESNEMVNALAEASRNSELSDRWEFADTSSEMHYAVVAPTVPASGNYSAYSSWIARVRDGIPANDAEESVRKNPAFSIAAGLMYTAQLVNVVAYYLNIRLPHKMYFSEFNSHEMDERQFTQRVACLNANILYLCFTQNVDISVLHSSNETIHNLLQLLNTKNENLGRIGPMEVDANLASLLEQPLSSDLNLNDSSDSDESFPNEWEAVPHVQCPEVAAGPVANIQSTQMIGTQQTNSVAGGLMNSAAASIASIWRGFTGR